MAVEYIENLATDQLVIDMSEDIAELDPDAGPLTVLLKKLNSEPCHSNKIEWLDSALPTLQDTINGTPAANATTITVDHGTRFHAGDVILIPETGYRGVVTAVSGNDLTVSVINEGSGAATDGENILIIGNAYKEGSNKSEPRQEPDTMNYNYTQIFKTGFGISKTLMSSKVYGGDRLARITREKEIEHLMLIDRTLWFGHRHGPNSSTDYGTMGGVMEFLENGGAKVKSVSTLTETAWNDWLRDIFEYHSSEPRYIFCSGLILQAINTWGASKLQLMPKDKTYGVTINRYLCAFGEVYLINNRRVFNALADSSKTGYEGTAVALILDHLKLRPLEGRDTKLYTNLQDPGADRREDEFLTELSLEVRLPQTAGILTGVQTIG